MHREILTQNQIKFLPLLKSFTPHFGLVGETAIALHIGHRESIDFDLFTQKPFRPSFIEKKFNINHVLVSKQEEFSFLADDVKFTFLHYPFPIEFSEKLEDIITLPSLLTLAAMKAYALGRRAKRKDYVDLYFILRDFYSIHDISEEAKKIFGSLYNEKLFRVQLAYFEDIDYSERVIFRDGFEVQDSLMKEALMDKSISE